MIAVVAALIFTGLGFKVAPAQSGATRYVDGAAGVDQGSCTDPTAACATIGYALEEAQNGDQILVSAGTYVENLDVYERVSIIGGHTVVGADWIAIPHDRSVLDGGGPSVALPAIRFHAEQVGLQTTTLRGFVITDSHTTTSGQAAAMVQRGSVIIQDCIVAENSTQGVVQEWGSGGILIHNGAAVLIDRTIVARNRTDGGAGAIRLGGSVMTVSNSLLYGNSGRPAIHTNNASATLENVTIAENGAAGGIFLYMSQATLRNAIVWEVAGPDIELAGEGSSYTITHSDTQDQVEAGASNSSADPLFVAAASGDFRLLPGSPAVGAGLASDEITYALDGSPRLGVPDMGAYELNAQVFLPLVDGE